MQSIANDARTYQNELIYLHNNIGQIYYDKKQHAKAINFWDGAINILEKQNAIAPPET
jgi:tetratricopeptide (TPR) repeat protein